MKLEEVDRSGQKWSEMKILDFIFRLEYLHLPRVELHLLELLVLSEGLVVRLHEVEKCV